MATSKASYQELESEITLLKERLAKYENNTEEIPLDIDEVSFKNIFNIDEIQKIQDTFAEAAGVASIITDTEGKPITKPSNFCRLCNDIIRGTEKGLKNCHYSDAIIGKYNTTGATYKPCLSGGLWDAGASISAGGKHIANWLIGQVVNADVDKQKILQYGKEIGANAEEFQKALNEVPEMPTEQFKKIADTIFLFTQKLSKEAYQNVQLKHHIIERQRKENLLLQATEKAREKERYSKMLFDTSPVGLALTSMDGKLHDVNIAYANIIGYSIDEALKLSFWDITPEKYKEDEIKRLNDLDEKGEYGPFEKEYFHKSGELVPVRLQGKIIDISGEKYIWSIVENISESKNNEKVLKEQNKKLEKAKNLAEESEKLKTAFLANMSHEIRTPMNSIIGFSQLLREPEIEDEDQEKFIDLIEQGGNRLLTIISDIVDVSKIDANQLSVVFHPCNINKLIDNLYQQFNISEHNSNVDIKTNKGLDDNACIVKTDEVRLMQILSNLIENALKFTHEGRVEFGYTAQNNHLEFYVKDSGMGIDPQYHNLIFDRFRQVNENFINTGSGTGLGLSIVKGLVELLGGKIWVESELDKGASFFFTIPN